MLRATSLGSESKREHRPDLTTRRYAKMRQWNSTTGTAPPTDNCLRHPPKRVYQEVRQEALGDILSAPQLGFRQMGFPKDSTIIRLIHDQVYKDGLRSLDDDERWVTFDLAAVSREARVDQRLLRERLMQLSRSCKARLGTALYQDYYEPTINFPNIVTLHSEHSSNKQTNWSLILTGVGAVAAVAGVVVAIMALPKSQQVAPLTATGKQNVAPDKTISRSPPGATARTTLLDIPPVTPRNRPAEVAAEVEKRNEGGLNERLKAEREAQQKPNPQAHRGAL